MLYWLLGRIRRAPNDKLDSQVASILQTPSETRSRIGRGHHLEATEYNPVGKIEKALEVILQAEPLFTKVCKETHLKTRFLKTRPCCSIRTWERYILNEQEAALLVTQKNTDCTQLMLTTFVPENSQQSHNIQVNRLITWPSQKYHYVTKQLSCENRYTR